MGCNIVICVEYNYDGMNVIGVDMWVIVCGFFGGGLLGGVGVFVIVMVGVNMMVCSGVGSVLMVGGLISIYVDVVNFVNIELSGLLFLVLVLVGSSSVIFNVVGSMMVMMDGGLVGSSFVDVCVLGYNYVDVKFNVLGGVLGVGVNSVSVVVKLVSVVILGVGNIMFVSSVISSGSISLLVFFEVDVNV